MKIIFFVYGCLLQREFLTVDQVLCAEVVDVTSSEDFLVKFVVTGHHRLKCAVDCDSCGHF